MKKLLTLIVCLTAMLMITASAQAITITGLTPNVTLNFGTGVGAGTQVDPIRIVESINDFGFVDLQFSDRGTGNPGGSGHSWGRWFRKEVTNNTSSAWTSFEHELQVILGTPSADGDGLSFAQGYTPRPFSSDLLPLWTEEILLKDFVNFYGGSVGVGQTVVFNLYVTDNVSRDTFYLRQRPNEPVPGQPIVPEPATLSLLGMGLSGLLGLRKKLA